MSKVEVGDKAPDFTGPSNTGENVTLSQFLGHKLLLILRERFKFVSDVACPP
jgi:peroxiredoxin